MWIVSIALRRPYTFIVLAMLLPLFAVLSLLRMPVDIFPSIPIPILAAAFNYGGLSAEEVASRITTQFERTISTLVNDIEHIESQSLSGMSVVKVFLHQKADVSRAQSQMTASAQSTIRQMPPGISPPLIIGYDAANVPVLQMAITSTRLAEHEINDLANNFIRVQLATVQGASIANAYGGKQRQILVDLDPVAMAARGITASDVTDAIAAQNLLLPGGTQKIGVFEYDVRLNASTETPEALNDLPVISTRSGTTYLHDIAHVRDGFLPQTNIVRVNGQRAVLTVVQRGAGASTLDIISRVKEMVPQIASTLPEDLEIRMFGDQSIFVKAAINGVIFEGTIAACLTGLLILLFLGSWRSTFIIFISIPLSIMAAVIVLAALGQSINIMTLSGFALAVGILVDDATVTIENINAHLEMGKPIEQAIMDGAQQIVLPALVSVMCICVVFLPMFFLSGVAGFLFVPMAQAVVFAMLASFVLSRTLVPTLARFWLKTQAVVHHEALATAHGFRSTIDAGFLRLRELYTGTLADALRRPLLFPAVFLGAVLLSLPLVVTLGTDFFPSVDAGQIKLHMRARTGLRIEETAALCDRVGQAVRQVIPAAEIESLIDNIGLPTSGLNVTYSNSAPTGSTDADISIALTRKHGSTADYVAQLREKLPREFPGVEFSFLPADIVSQILNLGLPSPIDVQVIGNNVQASRDVARKLLARFRAIPGLADLRIQQTFDRPQLDVTVDRTRAGDLGLTQRDIAQDMLISLSGSATTAPAYWLNPRTGVQYSVATQTPQHRLTSVDGLRSLPLGRGSDSSPRTLGQLAHISYSSTQGVVSHYNVQPVIDVYGAVQGRDFGGAVRDLRAVVAQMRPELPRGVRIETRGQMETMDSSFTGLYAGLALAILLVYLLLVITFQSWTDALIIVAALPAAIAGIIWCLFLTWTTLSVPALTGAIMCMGIATANSILVISFARERLALGDDPITAVLAAGHARFRPVLMTALAMIVGMSPMALGLGEGGEQNAPLGRAVVGGLAFATVATLFFVPAVFALLHNRRRALG
ncbi:MAG TPA: efflux RND transporter permease subunit [Steroidobacteraceae bacterium]|nr:efflux RND transporter permease subunit [Steroidobacteraceae bacterium]